MSPVEELDAVIVCTVDRRSSGSEHGDREDAGGADLGVRPGWPVLSCPVLSAAICLSELL